MLQPGNISNIVNTVVQMKNATLPQALNQPNALKNSYMMTDVIKAIPKNFIRILIAVPIIGILIYAKKAVTRKQANATKKPPLVIRNI